MSRRRNNEDRLGASPSAGAETPPPDMTQNTGNSQFNFVVPTEFVELPSKGRFYPQGHPLHMQESVEIRHMTAKDEDVLTSRTLLKQGVALNRFLNNILVDRSINTNSLLIGDKNAVIVAARISGYGSEYKTRIACPACLSNVEYEFDLTSAEINHGGQQAVDQVDITENGTFLIDLPASSATVEVKLLTGADEASMSKSAKGKNKALDISVTKQLKRMIVSVNGEASMRVIERFISVMPAKDSRHLRNVYKSITPNVDLTQNFECSECGHEQPLEVPFTADFFWPDR